MWWVFVGFFLPATLFQDLIGHSGVILQSLSSSSLVEYQMRHIAQRVVGLGALDAAGPTDGTY
ncbi:hypothetical protein, partial [Paraburkholderia caledonica]|uniref:hypothetical protein n=1 Tax=Paraburkholderia caledonica TaxID=134536 RepID=UPI0038BADB14